MARRKRRGRKPDAPPLLSQFDWSMNPDTAREIAAVVLVLLGIILLLAAAGSGGGFGQFVLNLSQSFIGIFAPIVGIALIAVGGALWFPDKFNAKPMSIVGVGLIVGALPALFPTEGGALGRTVADLLTQFVGPIGAVFVVFALLLIGVSLAANISLVKWFVDRAAQRAEENPTVNEPSTKVSVFETVQRSLGKRMQNTQHNAPVTAAPVMSAPMALRLADWEFPPLDLLDLPKTKATAGNVSKNVEVIGKTLKEFGIDVAMGDVNIGPTVTQYTLKPSAGMAVSQISARANDLALALAAHPIRIEAPIPGKAAVGIEVPNKVAATVTVREIMETDPYRNAKGPLTIALGRDAAGIPMVADLAGMPHLLIAGSTGSGKSIAINTILNSLLYRNSPETLRLILVDPKRVEFTPYNDLPHLLSPVIVEPAKTVDVLKWALTEMDRRFKVLQAAGSRDILSYNGSSAGKAEPLPYMVIVIDELADLMQQSAKEVEGAIVRLAQLARAVGMHLIVATQRPSVDVITGLIKANIITRMAFAVASQADSRTILDQGGAEKLLGKGDMLYVSAEFAKPKRIQGALITEREVKEVTGFFKARHQPQYEESVLNFQARGGSGGHGGGSGGNSEVDDDLYNDAKQLVIDAGKASASLLQRRLRVGYARAARLLDLLEEQGVIGQADGARPREVYGDGGTTTPGGGGSTQFRNDSYPAVNPNQGTLVERHELPTVPPSNDEPEL